MEDTPPIKGQLRTLGSGKKTEKNHIILLNFLYQTINYMITRKLVNIFRFRCHHWTLRPFLHNQRNLAVRGANITQQNYFLKQTCFRIHIVKKILKHHFLFNNYYIIILLLNCSVKLFDHLRGTE